MLFRYRLSSFFAALIAASILALACETDRAPIEETRGGDPIDTPRAGPGVPLTPLATEFPAPPVAPVDFLEECAVSWRAATQYIGLRVTLQGPVVDVRDITTITGDAVAIALGAGPGDPEGVDVVIPEFAVPRFNPPPDELYTDERICVRGYVASGADRLRVYVSTPAEVLILSEDAPTPVVPGGECVDPISWEEASEHLGELVNVEGPVVGSRLETAGPNELTILEVGEPSPTEGGFDVAIPSYALDNFDEPPEELYEGVTICVLGAIGMVNERPRAFVDRQESVFVE